MSEPAFWTIIESAARAAHGDFESLVDEVRTQLGKLTPPQIEAFNRLLYEKIDAAYRWSLWGAAYLINGGCSDDGFEDFRAWLISRGRAIYDAAVAQPDSLADFVDPEADCDGYQFEDLLSVARKAYKEVTRQEMPRHVRSRVDENDDDEWWDFDDAEEIAKRLPRLSALCGRR